jgi:hypothetical protein
MADYYPILARAVSSLPHNDAEARRDLYARARTIVTEQLRGRGLQAAAGEAIREQAELETAIRKVEAESRPVRTRMNGKPGAPRPPAQRAAVADAQDRAEKTAKSLSKILQAVHPNETRETDPQRSYRKSTNGTQALAPSKQSKAIATGVDATTKATAELGGAPGSLVTMLFATAYIVAGLAFTGVTYIRCIVWLYEGVIGYPILLAVMAVTLGLFIVPPVMIFRKTSALPTIDGLMRYIHSASRRVL